jgi:hypothetical protein
MKLENLRDRCTTAELEKFLRSGVISAADAHANRAQILDWDNTGSAQSTLAEAKTLSAVLHPKIPMSS